MKPLAHDRPVCTFVLAGTAYVITELGWQYRLEPDESWHQVGSVPGTAARPF